MVPGPASDFLNLQKCISKLRLVGKGTGPLSPKAETNLPPFLAALIHPGPCLLLVLSSTCASSLHLPQKGTSLPLFSTSATIMELRLYKTLDYTPRFRLAASSYTGWARTEGAVTWSRQASDDAQPNPALGYMLLPDPQEWRTHWCPLCCHVPHQVGSVYKRTEIQVRTPRAREAAHGPPSGWACPGSLPRPQAPWEGAAETGPAGRYHLLGCAQSEGQPWVPQL